MVSLPEYVQAAWGRVRSDALLLALPVVGTALQFENALRVLRAGPGGGVTFSFPTGFATLWSFVNVPTPEGVFVRPVAFVVGMLVNAALTAVYVPRVVERVRPGRGETRVDAALSRYFAPLFGIALALAAVGLVLVAAALALGPLVVLAFPLVLALGYALYAAPFLVVVEDRDAVDALSRSVDLATDGGAYASFGGQYLLLAALVSLPASTVVRAGVLTIALATVLAAPLAAATTGATAAFVVDLVDGRFDRGSGRSDDPSTPRDADRREPDARNYETHGGRITRGRDDDARDVDDADRHDR
ncbi:hypothetical protein [Halorubellus sp. PRR65]|uniref:hypothetical protein n=1 Tax=Halorubellus sp. PRR65 TaxID=3098148 RepID=UPI002B25A025|nr:hypothetical protein [Halorubellus sp. PRR65]